MPRFYFHLYNDIEAKDEEGKLLPDVAAVRPHAIEEAREMIISELRSKGEFSLSHWIEVEDERGEVVEIVKFGDAVKINP